MCLLLKEKMINFMIMEKKVIKVYSELAKRECTLTLDPELEKFKGMTWAPKVMEEIIKDLKKIKNWPK
jgi:hypothetical protein